MRWHKLVQRDKDTGEVFFWVEMLVYKSRASMVRGIKRTAKRAGSKPNKCNQEDYRGGIRGFTLYFPKPRVKGEKPPRQGCAFVFLNEDDMDHNVVVHELQHAFMFVEKGLFDILGGCKRTSRSLLDVHEEICCGMGGLVAGFWDWWENPE